MDIKIIKLINLIYIYMGKSIIINGSNFSDFSLRENTTEKFILGNEETLWNYATYPAADGSYGFKSTVSGVLNSCIIRVCNKGYIKFRIYNPTEEKVIRYESEQYEVVPGTQKIYINDYVEILEGDILTVYFPNRRMFYYNPEGGDLDSYTENYIYKKYILPFQFIIDVRDTTKILGTNDSYWFNAINITGGGGNFGFKVVKKGLVGAVKIWSGISSTAHVTLYKNGESENKIKFNNFSISEGIHTYILPEAINVEENDILTVYFPEEQTFHYRESVHGDIETYTSNFLDAVKRIYCINFIYQ